TSIRVLCIRNNRQINGEEQRVKGVPRFLTWSGKKETHSGRDNCCPLLPQRRTCAQHAVGEEAISGSSATSSRTPRLEFAAPNPPEPQPQRLNGVPDRVLDIEELALEIAPLRQQKPQPVALVALDMNLPEPARAHDVGNPAGICLVGLVAHRRQRGSCMLGFNADCPASLVASA